AETATGLEKSEKRGDQAAINARKRISVGPCAFLSPRSPPHRIHWPLATTLSLPATTSPPPADPPEIGWYLALFTHRRFHLFAFSGHWSLSSRPTLRAPRSTPHDRRVPPSMPRAELGTALPTRRESTCYDMLRFPVSPEVWRASFSEQVHIQ